MVTYIVIHRYRYKVPIIKKNLRPTIDLKVKEGRENTEYKVCMQGICIKQLWSSSFIRWLNS